MESALQKVALAVGQKRHPKGDPNGGKFAPAGGSGSKPIATGDQPHKPGAEPPKGGHKAPLGAKVLKKFKQSMHEGGMTPEEVHAKVEEIRERYRSTGKIQLGGGARAAVNKGVAGQKNRQAVVQDVRKTAKKRIARNARPAGSGVKKVAMSIGVDPDTVEFADRSMAYREKAPTAYGTSFPIGNETDLKAAIQSFGRAPAEKKATVKAFIKRRARELGCPELIPDGW